MNDDEVAAMGWKRDGMRYVMTGRAGEEEEEDKVFVFVFVFAPPPVFVGKLSGKCVMRNATRGDNSSWSTSTLSVVTLTFKWHALS